MKTIIPLLEQLKSSINKMMKLSVPIKKKIIYVISLRTIFKEKSQKKILSGITLELGLYTKKEM